MKAAFYECDITPPLGGFLWGHYKRVIAADVADRLYAKAVVTESNGEIAAIVTVDCCALPDDMHDAVTKRVCEYTEIPAERVCLHSNHTHWGAPIFGSPELRCFADETYRDVCYRLTADAVILAYMRLEEASAGFGVSELADVSFNRDYVLENGQAITFGRSSLGVKKMLAGIDPSVSVMSFERDGKPVGALVNFACHQCCCGGIEAYSGDFSSVLSKEMKKRYGNDFVTVFLLGTCGDINHVNSDRVTKAPDGWYREIGKRLAEKAVEAMHGSETVEEGVRVAKELVRIPTRQAELEETKKKIAHLLEADKNLMRLRNLVVYEASNTEEYKELWVQAIKIGEVCIYAFPGEVFVNFGLQLKEKAPFRKIMVAENCNAYCGYIPTKEAFGENCDLYETSLCHHSCLVPEAGDILVEKLLGLIK